MKTQASFINQEGLIDSESVAKRLMMTARGVKQLAACRKIPCVRLGHRTLRFDWQKVEAAIAKLEVHAV